MLRLKKVYREELLQLAILLSLIRTDRLHSQLTATPALPAVGLTAANDEYWESSGGDAPSWWRNAETVPSVHPKSVYWRDVEEEHDILYYLNGGRAGGGLIGNIWQRNVTAYVGITAGPSTSTSTTGILPMAGTSTSSTPSPPSSSSSSSSPTSVTSSSSSSSSPQSSTSSSPEMSAGSTSAGNGHHKSHEIFSSEEDNDLTQEDMDLIEILWKQDVDMGFSVGEWSENVNSDHQLSVDDDEVDEGGINVKLKEPILKEKDKIKDDNWSRNEYSIDLETGEYIKKEERTEPEELSEDEPPSSLLPEPDFSLEEALELVGLNDGIDELLDHSGDIDGTIEEADEKDEKNKETVISSGTVTKVQQLPQNDKNNNNATKTNNNNNKKYSKDNNLLSNNIVSSVATVTTTTASSTTATRSLEVIDDEDDDDDLTNFDSSSVEELEAAASAAAVDLLEGRLADIFVDMIQSPPPFSPTSTSSSSTNYQQQQQQGRVGYSRTVSMEQRWQDLASLLSLQPEHHPHHLHHHHHHHHHHQPPHHATTAAAVPPPPPPPPPPAVQHPHHPLPQHPPHHTASTNGAGGGSGGGGGGGNQQPQPPSSATTSPSIYQPHTPQHHHHHHHIKTGGLSHLSPEPTGATAAALSPPTLTQPHYGSPLGPNNVGSAVASSMNLMTNSSEPMGGEAAATTFKMEGAHDMMYYQQNSTNEMNHSTEGFLSSILNDEDLQLMDMAMNEGMYTMRMLESNNNNGATITSGSGSGGGGGSGGADSDSAVSSMDSERVPSLTSDADWMEETNSDSGHTSADHYHPADYTSAFTKYRWYDYGYSGTNRQLPGESSNAVHRGGQQTTAPQKKHHMYGKRIFHEQSPGATSLNGGCGGGSLKLEEEPSSPYMSPPLEVTGDANTHPSELKYSCSVEFSRQTLGHQGIRSTPAQIAAHNHTYHMLPEDCNSPQRPLARDKKGRKSEEETHLTRDERRARSLNIPITVDDIINLPMDEFNERLSKYDLSENQLSLIRDIRRRGKNKVAAQNCRKRKLDQILSLADEVKQMRERKHRLLHERQVLLAERHRVKTRTSQLYRHIFQSLRDSDGNPYSPYEWSLQQTADGAVILVPRCTASGGPGPANVTSILDQDLPKRKPHDHQSADP